MPAEHNYSWDDQIFNNCKTRTPPDVMHVDTLLSNLANTRTHTHIHTTHAHKNKMLQNLPALTIPSPHIRVCFSCSDHDNENNRSSEAPDDTILDAEPTIAVCRVFARG